MFHPTSSVSLHIYTSICNFSPLFSVSSSLDKPWSQASSLLPPGTNTPSFLSSGGLCIASTARRFSSNFHNFASSRSRSFRDEKRAHNITLFFAFFLFENPRGFEPRPHALLIVVFEVQPLDHQGDRPSVHPFVVGLNSRFLTCFIFFYFLTLRVAIARAHLRTSPRTTFQFGRQRTNNYLSCR